MKPIDIVIIVIIAAILGFAIWYIRRCKKRGEKCVGCPNSKQCGAGQCGSCGGCSEK